MTGGYAGREDHGGADARPALRLFRRYAPDGGDALTDPISTAAEPATPPVRAVRVRVAAYPRDAGAESAMAL